MLPETGLFYVAAAISLGSAIVVVTARNMVRAIFMFFVSLFAIAGIYIFSLADFIALTQIIVYAGGVLVLMLFAFMLSDKDLLNKTIISEAGRQWDVNKVGGLIVAGAFLTLLILMIRQNDLSALTWLENTGNHFTVSTDTAPTIGITLMTRYLLPFEVVSIFLLMALIGAVHLSRKAKNA